KQCLKFIKCYNYGDLNDSCGVLRYRCLGFEGVRSLFGELRGCDSEARPRNRFWEVEGVRSL
ncbi:hypothetical protein MEO43_26660, partial [Dolichospermum sp. ST_sed5]|nr:hypothetical protein [Dolichospermum sp. ST_sed5]